MLSNAFSTVVLWMLAMACGRDLVSQRRSRSGARPRTIATTFVTEVRDCSVSELGSALGASNVANLSRKTRMPMDCASCNGNVRNPLVSETRVRAGRDSHVDYVRSANSLIGICGEYLTGYGYTTKANRGRLRR